MLRWILGLVFVLVLSVSALGQIRFDRLVVDSEGPKDPWAKILADINADGFTDVIIGGRKGPLVWYAYPNWDKHVITDGGYNTVDGEAGDIDGDGDLDIVMGGLIWYENPNIIGMGALRPWKAHKVADHPTHDIELGDLDGDGKLDIVTRDQSEFGSKKGDKIYLWRQGSEQKWTHKVLTCAHGEGIELADLDGDGDADIVIGGTWFENDGQGLAGDWPAHVFGQWHPNATVQVADIDADGRLDVVLSPSELKGIFYKMSWFQAPADPKAGNWTEHLIADRVECVIHGLVTADMNADGTIDVVASEMHQGADPDEVTVFFNGRKGASWTKQVISTKGSHYIQTADIDADGDVDLLGANWSGPHQPIELWINQTRDSRESKLAESAGGRKPLVVYLVRHAEKAGSGRDPELSQAGRQRAVALAQVLSNAGIEHVHSSDFLRTRNTAAPTAAQFDLKVQLYDPRNLPALAKKLKSAGGRHLVVGHSNTTPKMTELLGGDPGPRIDESNEYDRLYIVEIAPDGTVTSTMLRYGKPYLPGQAHIPYRVDRRVLAAGRPQH